MRLASGWPLFLAIAAVAAGVDLATKTAIFARLGMPGTGRRVVLVPDLLVLETNLNEGALFGLGQGLGWLFVVVSAVALAGILVMVSRSAARTSLWLCTGLGLIAGGILGNLYDRLGLPGLTWHAPAERRGEPVRAVRDWIHATVPGVIDWPIFNLADTWLVIGAGMLLLFSLRTPAAGDAPLAEGDPSRSA